MAGNSTSLYTSVPSYGVSSNNFTTLYNQNGQQVIAQLPYGNSNVEAFLNSGTDGSNIVQNIVANGAITSNAGVTVGGNLTVNNKSFLGNVGNVQILGGTLNYVLTTDGEGDLTWAPPYVPPPPTPNPFIHFDVTSNANNQSFTDSGINSYGSNTYINLFKNGVNIEPAYFIKTSNNTVQVNIPLTTGDTIDILASDASTGSLTPAAGNTYDIQFNSSNQFDASDNFTYNPGLNTLTVGNISGNISGSVGNLITVNSNVVFANYVHGDGSNLSNITAGNINGIVPFATHSSTSDVANLVAGANVTGTVANATYAITSGSATSATTAGTVTASSQPVITTIGTLTGLNVSGNTDLGDVSDITILGGTANYVLQTDGTGNLSWTAQTGGGNATSPGGSNTSVQFNDGGSFAGDGYLLYNFSTTTLSSPYFVGNAIGMFGIPGGNVNGQVSFAAVANSVAGANVSGDVSGSNHANVADVANSVAAANIVGSINLANYASIANSVAGANVSGAVTYASIANSVAGANVSGVVANATYANISGTTYNVSGSNVVGIVGNATHSNVSDLANSVAVANVVGLGNIATLNLTGSPADVLYGNGVFASVTGTANYANYAGNAFSVTGSNVSGQVSNSLVAGTVYTNAQPNITSVGTLSSLSVSGVSTLGNVSVANITSTGNVMIQRAFEVFTPNATGATGTVNFDALTQSIVYQTANSSGNITLNIRGNSSTTFDSLLPINEAMTIVYLNTVGANSYVVTTVNIDGVTISPKYVNGATPSGSTLINNSVQSYTYSILKTASNTYTVLGSFTEYQ